VAQELSLRLEERLAERTRIAQELHDTLLQDFLSASMQLHVANDQLAVDSPAKPLVARVLDMMGRAIEKAEYGARLAVIQLWLSGFGAGIFADSARARRHEASPFSRDC